MRKTPKSEADIIQGPFKVKTRRQMDEELRELMAEGGDVKKSHIKGVHEADRGHKRGDSYVGQLVRDGKQPYANRAAKEEHEEALKQLREMPDPKLKGMAEGGMVHPKSIVEAIRAKRMAEGGMVDIESNEMEEPNMLDELNEAALKENYDEDISDLDQPEDSNMHGDDIIADRMDRIASIRRRLHKMR